MNAFSWLVLACVAICAALAVRAMRRDEIRQVAADFGRMLARERVKELTKQCDFEAQQMKKAEQANLNGEKTE